MFEIKAFTFLFCSVLVGDFLANNDKYTSSSNHNLHLLQPLYMGHF